MQPTGRTHFDRRRAPHSWAIGWLLSMTWGCTIPPTPAPLSPIQVAAASDLQAVLPEVIRRFEIEHPGVEVVVSFGSSGKLAEQIREGAPFDLFLAANVKFVDELAAEGFANVGSVRPYAVGSLVMAVATDAPGTIEAISDLSKPEVKTIAIANPDLAPYGAAARQALKKAGLWEKVEPKLVLAESVRQAFQFAETGNAEVAFVGRALTKGRDIRVVAVDPGLYEPIVQGMGVVARSKRKAEAEAFARFLTGEQGQSILKSFGFNPPPPKDSVGP